MTYQNIKTNIENKNNTAIWDISHNHPGPLTRMSWERWKIFDISWREVSERGNFFSEGWGIDHDPKLSKGETFPSPTKNLLSSGEVHFGQLAEGRARKKCPEGMLEEHSLLAPKGWL